MQLCQSEGWLESRRHSKLEPGSEEEKPNDGEGSLVGPDGPESIVVWGGVASTVQVRTIGLGSGFPAASTARTRKVCEPSERFV